MARFIFILLIIAAINKQTLPFSILGMDFEDIQSVYHYVNEIYEKGIEYVYKEEIEKDNAENQLRKIMVELKDMSKQLTNFVSHQDEKIDKVVKVLLDNMETIGEFQSLKSDIIREVDNVEFWFEQGLKYETHTGFSDESRQNFIKSVLWGSDNIEHRLFNIYKIIFPGESTYIRKSFLSAELDTTQDSYDRLCDKYISPQQKLYYIFLYLIRIQLKGFMTVTQAYAMQTAYDHVNFTRDFKFFKETFDERLTNYIEHFIDYLAAMPADVRRCDVEDPVIGKNVYEMEGLFQVLIDFEGRIKSAIHGRFLPYCGGCEEIFNDFRTKYVIHSCKSYTTISGCPATEFPDYESSVRYSSFTADSEDFGHREQCNHTVHEINRFFDAAWCWNDLCVCSVNVTEQNYFSEGRWGMHVDEPKIRKISVEPQYSDVANNMIIVGVKFILHEDAIHLQIQQSKIAKGGAILDKGLWKPVNVDNNNNTINIRYETLFDRRSRLYLDDVLGHPDSVVTGVKFAITKDGSGFELHIQSTKYNYKTGQLTNLQSWVEPGRYVVHESDYQRNRDEIKLNDPDDPTMAHSYKPNPQSNTFVQFQHSSIKKDAGYHTVPFFDGQPVETQMKFPLSGIGLFHRGRDGFGGYIAPRLITYNVSLIMESSFKNWEKLEKMYKDCGLQVPVNVTVYEESADCEKLKQIADRQVPNRNINQINRNNTINFKSVSNYNFTLIKAQNITHKSEEGWKQKIKKNINEYPKHTTSIKKNPCLPKNVSKPSITRVHKKQIKKKSRKIIH